jgi:dCMP deaminase
MMPSDCFTCNDAYFLSKAQLHAQKSSCDRKRIGVVFVVDRQIVASGYNASLPGHASCDDVGHLMVDGHCLRTVHAEALAIGYAARQGVPLLRSTCYLTCSPCSTCLKLLLTAGVARIVALEFYRDGLALALARQSGVPIEIVEGSL